MNTQSIAYEPDYLQIFTAPTPSPASLEEREDREVRACYLGQFQATVWHQGHWITEWSGVLWCDDERLIGIEITPVTA